VLAEVDTPGHTEKARAGVGNLATNAPVPWDAEFRIASFTKPFVATTLLQLVGEGRLSLDDTIGHWLPGVVTGNGNDGNKITVRQLLQHTGGIPNYTDTPEFTWATEQEYDQARFRTYTPAQLVALAMTMPPTFAPGTGFNYSNTDYVLAGMIIQRVTGHRWQDEVTRRIIRPLGLRHTLIPTSPFIRGPHAHGYQQFAADGPLVDVTALNPTGLDAAGAIVSTTADGNRFLRALLGGRTAAAGPAGADGDDGADATPIPTRVSRNSLRPRHHVDPEPVRRVLDARRGRSRLRDPRRGEPGRHPQHRHLLERRQADTQARRTAADPEPRCLAVRPRALRMTCGLLATRNGSPEGVGGVGGGVVGEERSGVRGAGQQVSSWSMVSKHWMSVLCPIPRGSKLITSNRARAAGGNREYTNGSAVTPDSPSTGTAGFGAGAAVAAGIATSPMTALSAPTSATPRRLSIVSRAEMEPDRPRSRVDSGTSPRRAANEGSSERNPAARLPPTPWRSLRWPAPDTHSAPAATPP
jgi:D-alanyl-D-alanine carboxypeptidase